MRNPETILKALSSHSTESHYRYKRLYRILFNEEMFYTAYRHIVPPLGNMTEGHPMAPMSITRIKSLIVSLKDESYQPRPARRVYIRKKNGDFRVPCMASTEDRLLQEAVKMLLEAIYEGHFKATSHGFRAFKRRHTALKQIRRTFTGAKWFIGGELKGFFDNISHEVLMNILRERIADERFLRLIYKFLKAGFIGKADCGATYPGQPQDGTVSSVIGNIYLAQLDKYMKEYAAKYDKGAKRKVTVVNKRRADRADRLRRKMPPGAGEIRKRALLERIRQAKGRRLSEAFEPPMAEGHRRLKYVRYADDFLIGVIGSRQDCQRIKEDIATYMESALKLGIRADSLLITHSSDNARFLGFDITLRRPKAMRHEGYGHPKRAFGSKVMLKLSSETVKGRLRSYDAIRFTTDSNGKMKWMPKARAPLLTRNIEEILAIYNSQIKGFCDYYGIADNASSRCAAFSYIMEYSLYMTIGEKLRKSLREVINKYRKDKIFSVPYKDKKGNLRRRILYHDGFRGKESIGFPFVDYRTRHTFRPSDFSRKAEKRIWRGVWKDGEVNEGSPRGIILQRGGKRLAAYEECNSKILKKEN